MSKKAWHFITGKAAKVVTMTGKDNRLPSIARAALLQKCSVNSSSRAKAGDPAFLKEPGSRAYARDDEEHRIYTTMQRAQRRNSCSVAAPTIDCFAALAMTAVIRP